MPLGHVPEAREVAEVRARHTEDVDLSGEKVSEPEQPFGDCRFPGAVGAQDEDDLTGGDGEVDIVDDGVIAVAEGGSAQRDDRGSRGGWIGRGGSGGVLMSSPVRCAGPRGWRA